MYPPHEHAFYIWCIAIAAVGIATLIGAFINRIFLNRKLRRIRCVSVISEKNR
ncbi:MAG: hypothetical protein K2M72_09660 [Paramuribaculum sp.]|nr:hypothetical protein [Paramuribaculum sp.]